LLAGHFEKAAFSAGPYLLMRVEASLDLESQPSALYLL